MVPQFGFHRDLGTGVPSGRFPHLDHGEQDSSRPGGLKGMPQSVLSLGHCVIEICADKDVCGSAHYLITASLSVPNPVSTTTAHLFSDRNWLEEMDPLLRS